MKQERSLTPKQNRDLSPKRRRDRETKLFRYDDERLERRAVRPVSELIADGETNRSLILALASATDKALERLTPRQREAIMLYHYEGLSQHEIARRWGVSPSSVNRLLARAYAKIRELIIIQ